MANDYTPIDEYSRDRLASWHRWQQVVRIIKSETSSQTLYL